MYESRFHKKKQTQTTKDKPYNIGQIMFFFLVVLFFVSCCVNCSFGFVCRLVVFVLGGCFVRFFGFCFFCLGLLFCFLDFVVLFVFISVLIRNKRKS